MIRDIMINLFEGLMKNRRLYLEQLKKKHPEMNDESLGKLLDELAECDPQLSKDGNKAPNFPAIFKWYMAGTILPEDYEASRRLINWFNQNKARISFPADDNGHVIVKRSLSDFNGLSDLSEVFAHNTGSTPDSAEVKTVENNPYPYLALLGVDKDVYLFRVDHYEQGKRAFEGEVPVWCVKERHNFDINYGPPYFMFTYGKYRKALFCPAVMDFKDEHNVNITTEDFSRMKNLFEKYCSNVSQYMKRAAGNSSVLIKGIELYAHLRVAIPKSWEETLKNMDIAKMNDEDVNTCIRAMGSLGMDMKDINVKLILRSILSSIKSGKSSVELRRKFTQTLDQSMVSSLVSFWDEMARYNSSLVLKEDECKFLLDLVLDGNIDEKSKSEILSMMFKRADTEPGVYCMKALKTRWSDFVEHARKGCMLAFDVSDYYIRERMPLDEVMLKKACEDTDLAFILLSVMLDSGMDVHPVILKATSFDELGREGVVLKKRRVAKKKNNE